MTWRHGIQTSKRTDSLIGSVGLFGLLALGTWLAANSPSAATTPAAPTPAQPPAVIIGDLKADYIITEEAIGCAILNEGALSTGKATGRIFDLSDPDHCRGITAGTAVLSQKRFLDAVCVVPEGASAPCLWVLKHELKPMQIIPLERSSAADELLTTTAARADGNVVVSTPVQACAKVTTQCRELAVGTVVVEQNYWGNTSCVLPAGAAPPCLWVNVNALTYPKGYQPVRMTQEQLDQNQKERRYAGDPPIPGEPPGGRLQIQFQRGVSNGSYLQELVSMRNTSGTDFASVAWDCSFYDKNGYKVGGGAAIFYLVRKLSITHDSMSFPLNGAIGLVEKITCELIGTERVTKENARLYQPGTQWGTASISSIFPGFWNGDYEPQGNAVLTPSGGHSQ
jgi:hypothetical protein